MYFMFFLLMYVFYVCFLNLFHILLVLFFFFILKLSFISYYISISFFINTSFVIYPRVFLITIFHICELFIHFLLHNLLLFILSFRLNCILLVFSKSKILSFSFNSSTSLFFLHALFHLHLFLSRPEEALHSFQYRQPEPDPS
jgi:hypothetical protein